MAKQHKVKQGECLSSIAEFYGFCADTLWNDRGNQELKKLRKDYNVLYPGDVVAIPEKQEKNESGSTELLHRFRKHDVNFLKLRILENSEPKSNIEYNLSIDGAQRTGMTDDDGMITEPIPATASQVTLMLGPNREGPYNLQLGGLDPIDTISGIQERLFNLGYSPGPLDGKDGPRTQASVQAFQGNHDLVVDGIAGPKTQAVLKDVYGN